MSSFDRLIAQIDAFIRKFYKNQLVKGFILFTGILLFTYLLVITLEFFGRFSSIVRMFFFFGFIGVNTFVLVKYILVPLLRLRSFGNRINRYQASLIIGRFFPGISDRLLNTLQLSDQMDENSTDFELINASVQQRSAAMGTVPFANAIDLSKNKRYLGWVFPVVFVGFLFGVFEPEVYWQGTDRVMNFSNEFPEEAPFRFDLVTDLKPIEEGENYEFELELSGDDLPEKVYVKSNQGKFLLKRSAKNRFYGILVQVRKKVSFCFEATAQDKEVVSTTFVLDVIAKTAIGKLQASLDFPAYLEKERQTIQNSADLIVPEGTTVSWSVLTKNSSATEFWINNKKNKFVKDGFTLSNSFPENSVAKIILKNRSNNVTDTTEFIIDVVKDQYPTIQVVEAKDSLKDGVRYFSGVVGDDYGLTGLQFIYKITSKTNGERKEQIDVGRVFGTENPFDFAVDFRKEAVTINDKIEYYFVVYDNDGVNGRKATRSTLFTYKLPSLSELIEKREDEQEKIKDDMQSLLEKADTFKKDLEKLKNEIRDSKKSSWNKESQIRQLKEAQKSLIENLDDLKEKIETSTEERTELSEVDKEILEKEEMIKDLLDELMDDELKELLDQLEELLKKNDEQGLEETMDKLEMSSEEMKNQLDRSLEMLKKTQVDEKIDAVEEKLKELADKEKALSEQTKQKKNISNEDKQAQEEIEKEFDEIKKDLNELDSLNENLERPMDLGSPETQSDQVDEKMNEAKEGLDKNKGKKASKGQQGAAEKMEEMAQTLDDAQSQSNQEQQEEDMEMLRNILEGLVTLSFDQEETMVKLKRVAEEDPAFVRHSRGQRRIVDDTRILRDSLMELAKRQPKIATFIDKELNQISANHDLILEDIDERRRRELTIHQQYVMTSYNNLALMLNEALEQMQQQMRNAKPGSGSCNKPGGSGMPKPGSGMSSKSIKEMLQKQLDAMKKGKSPGGKKPGGKKGEQPGGSKPGGEGSGGLGLGSKEIAKMAAEQGAIRRRLEQMRKELNKDGSGNGNKLNPLIENLEDQEHDLINKKLNNNTLDRQKKILTRLLESEKALMERGIEEKRESKEGKNKDYSNQIRFEEYNKEKLRQIELLRAVDPSYKKYYKDKANEYFNRVF